jgi:hypothetical protein
MQGECLFHIALECCMLHLHASDCVSSDEGDGVAGKGLFRDPESC